MMELILDLYFGFKIALHVLFLFVNILGDAGRAFAAVLFVAI